MRHGEATCGSHGIETGRQFAGEADREVSTLTAAGDDLGEAALTAGVVRFKCGLRSR